MASGLFVPKLVGINDLIAQRSIIFRKEIGTKAINGISGKAF